MAAAFSPPAVAQEDYRSMLLKEDSLLYFFGGIVPKIWNIFNTCRILWVRLIQQTVQKEPHF